MANKCKRKSQRKTEMIGIRVTPKEKERIEKDPVKKFGNFYIVPQGALIKKKMNGGICCNG